ncbi:hypothetical protein I350_08395 [Cryptococcus amylolentus CBS 6273]|uniref:Fork-head domain-containing protein n=1 Tax=Cryptococcus amylolentus CBS 6273 TaxID=1296118 RepID=A0A1E3J489_9TREE|nr:hypothetical protein I350_08395 [Cryptococcus amylolentus CBS 6273]
MSPNANHNSLHYPPSFDPHHTSSRYPANQGHAHSHSRSYSHSSSHSHRTAAPQGTYSVYSPYRPGEYGPSERGVMMGDRTGTGTGVERKLFGEGDEVQEEEGGWRGHRASSPLAPAFEPKMVLRNGASIDLISWLRTNFIHSPPPHNAITPPMPLNGIRHLLLERFPRAPEVSEIHKAVLAAFPHSQWDYAENNSEPPSMRGLKWAGRDVEEDYELEEGYQARHREEANGAARQSQPRGRMSNGNGTKQSRSPTQSTLVSPISSSKRPLPDTPARSVLEEFAEIATLTGKTPGSRTKSLPGEPLAASPDSADLAVEDGLLLKGKKRVATDSPERSGGHQRRASSSDKLHGLLAAAEAVEGSPLTTILPPNATASANAHKRRRTIGGSGPAREMMAFPRRALSARGTMSPPPVNGMGHGQRGSGNGLRQVEENVDYVVPLNDTAFAAPASASSSSSALPGPLTAPANGNGNPTSSSTVTPSRTSRKLNELPTDGDRPGFDCKPPYPYHEMIRHAIEQAPDRRLQLNQIYASIAERFPFFKTLDEKKTAGWQNSIRHNLSLKKMFVRVNKIDGIPDDTAGKGGWWTVIPGVPDEGRPGRKAKARKAKELAARQLLIDQQAAEEAKALDEARARDRGGERDGPEPSPAELARMDRERMMDMERQREREREHELRQREKREREAREAMAWVEQQDRAEMAEKERRRKEGKENEPLLAGAGGRVPMGEAPREYVAGDKRPEGWMGGVNGWA